MAASGTAWRSRQCALFLAVIGLAGAVADIDSCSLGILKAGPDTAWQQNRTTYLDAYVSYITQPRKEALSRVPPTSLEAGLVAELRPPLAPSTRPRLCLRSLAAAVAGAGGACVVPGLADAGPGVLGAPDSAWACLEVTGDTASITITEDNNSEYCAANGRCLVYVTSWRLAAAGVTSAGAPLLQLSYEYVVKDYDDVSNRYDGTLSTLTYQLTSGCILGQAAARSTLGAAASPGAAACVACSAAGPADPRWTPGHAADASSPTCVRGPRGTAQQARSAWTCIPGLPSGFETIAVRLSSTGVPECASADGKKCSRTAPVGTSCGAWAAQLNAAAAADTVSSAAAQPLRCGADHQRAWGITGFDTPGHWCNLASDYFQNQQSGGDGPCSGPPLN